MFFTKIYLAEIGASIKSDNEEFIRVFNRRFRGFCINDKLASHFTINVSADNDWSNDGTSVKGLYKIKMSSSRLIVSDRYLKCRGNFVFACDKGEIGINDYWYHSLVPYMSRVFAYYLLNNGGFFLHSAAAVKNGICYVFLGPSGAGKTTIANILKNKGYKILHDDFVCINSKGKTYSVYNHPFKTGSFFCYDNFLIDRINIFFLEKGKKSSIKKVFNINYISDLIKNIYQFNDYLFLLKNNFDISCKFIKQSDVYRFTFNYYDRSWAGLF
ncbi:MAG: hypothetical protein PHQ54_02020 [Candidatus Omnitrophica bacterium]|nr:hypothetical protein [Candidatus Omnitrophota bacterium]